MARRSGTCTSLIILQIAVGLFFILIGIQGIESYNSSMSVVGRNLSEILGVRSDITEIIIAVLELVSGVIIMGALFAPVHGQTLRIATMIVFLFWLARVVLVYLPSGQLLEPNLLTWLKNLSLDMIVLIAIWSIGSRRT